MQLLKKENSAFDFSEILKDPVDLLCCSLYAHMDGSRGGRGYFFCGSFMFLFCLVFAMSLYASIYMCFVVTCWERADLLALVCRF